MLKNLEMSFNIKANICTISEMGAICNSPTMPIIFTIHFRLIINENTAEIRN